MASLLYWKGLSSDIKQWVRECPVCQNYKADLATTLGLIQPLPILTRAWAVINMDFVEGLPNSRGKNVILVVVDRLTKYGHFVPLAHLFTASL